MFTIINLNQKELLFVYNIRNFVSIIVIYRWKKKYIYVACVFATEGPPAFPKQKLWQCCFYDSSPEEIPRHC